MDEADSHNLALLCRPRYFNARATACMACVSVCLFVCWSACRVCPFSACLFVCLFACLPVSSVCLLFVCLSVMTPARLNCSQLACVTACSAHCTLCGMRVDAQAVSRSVSQWEGGGSVNVCLVVGLE